MDRRHMSGLDFSVSGGVDFVPLDQVVTLRQEEPRTCFDILTIDDAVVEPIEIITVSLTNANGVAVGVSKVSISIVDNGDCKCFFNSKPFMSHSLETNFQHSRSSFLALLLY